jgi:RNA polymerase sigma-70 factor (ECF subfamily)
MLIERTATEDAVQETFLRIWRRADAYDPDRGPPAAWIITIARNVARTAAHGRGSRLLVPPREPAVDLAKGVVDRLWLRDALATLTEPERVALELAYFADLSHSQVAAALGEPLGTVKARIRRALIRLASEGGEG